MEDLVLPEIYAIIRDLLPLRARMQLRQVSRFCYKHDAALVPMHIIPVGPSLDTLKQPTMANGILELMEPANKSLCELLYSLKASTGCNIPWRNEDEKLPYFDIHIPCSEMGFLNIANHLTSTPMGWSSMDLLQVGCFGYKTVTNGHTLAELWDHLCQKEEIYIKWGRGVYATTEYDMM